MNDTLIFSLSQLTAYIFTYQKAIKKIFEKFLNSFYFQPEKLRMDSDNTPIER